MKKIIIAQRIMHALGGHDMVLGRGNIMTYLAQTSEEILNIHKIRKVDLIITEDTLPLMGGAELCSRIRGDRLLKNVSIVMVADEAGVSRAKWRGAGANAVLPKPLDSVHLFSTMTDLLVIPLRKDMRVPLRVSVKHLESKTSFIAASQNISISGMLLVTNRMLKKGDHLRCTFDLAHNKIELECMITRTHAAASGKLRYGVKFLHCDTKSLIIIENFVKSQAVKQVHPL